MNRFFAVCVFAFYIASASATSVLPGKCPEPTRLAQPFDLNQYLGTWYEIQSTNPTFEFHLRCIQNVYKIESTGEIVFDLKALNKHNRTTTSVGFVKTTDQDNVLEMEHPICKPYVPYWIVDTDYTSYSLVVLCFNTIYDYNSLDVLILSREPTLDDKIVDKLVAKLNSVGITGTKFIETGKNCRFN